MVTSTTPVEQRMSRYQRLVVALAIAMVLVDGLDLSIMAYSAASIAEEWNVQPGLLGYLLSASLFGLAGGAVLLTPLADVIGRRRLTNVAFGIGLVGMVGSTFSADPTMLLGFRVVTGFGFGGVMASLIVMVSEYSSTRRRGALISLYAAGYPIGATLGGLIAGPLLATSGWRSVFLTATALSAILFAVSLAFLPESIGFLLAKQPPGALERANVLLTRIGREKLDSLPTALVDERSPRTVRAILTPPQLVRSALLWVGYGCLSASFYVVSSWVPRMITSATGDESLGVTVGTLVSVGGIAGSILFGLVTLRIRAWKLLVVVLLACACSYVLFSAFYQQPVLAVVVAFLIGMVTMAAIAGFYVLAANVYAVPVRATGTGWMIGIGRLASIAAPIAVGVLLENGWQPSSLFLLFATPFVVAAGCAVAVAVLSKRSSSDLTGGPAVSEPAFNAS